MRAVLAALAVIGACASPVDSATPTPPTMALVAAHCHSVNGLPDPRCTPGAIDPAVTQSNIGATICRVGYTATIRPPASFTNALKRQQMAEYGETGPPSGYQEDHRVPLEIAGDPRSINNLWPEGKEQAGTAPIGRGAKTKDRLENYVHKQICSGQMTLAQGQAVFLGDFLAWAAQHLSNAQSPVVTA